MILNTAVWEQTITEAKAKASRHPRWLRAIERGALEIERAPYWSFVDGVLTIISTTSGHHYTVAEGHACAARDGICKHRAARRLMQRYVALLTAQAVEAASGPAAPLPRAEVRRAWFEGAQPN